MPTPSFADRYNTALTKEQEAAAQAWLAQQQRTADLADYDMRGAFRAGQTAGANGHFTDAYKKPNHPTFSDESIYDGADGEKGGRWEQAGKTWTFTPGPSNLKYRTADELRAYFAEHEPDARLILPDEAAHDDELRRHMGGPATVRQ